MQIADAQREVRLVFLGGFVGTAVSSGLWLLSAASSTWGSPRRGIVLLVLGGALILLVFAFVGRAAASPEQTRQAV